MGYAYSGLYHGYAGYHAGYPYAYYGKRSADAEPEAKADPWVTYGAYPYAYGYSGLYHGYAGYPYAYHYGKRSADAEPDADAYYGYYGCARPYAYGYRYGGYRGYYWG